MFAQLLRKCNGARGIVPRDVGLYLLEIAFGSSTKPKLHQRAEARSPRA
jgi:hypothetical protein